MQERNPLIPGQQSFLCDINTFERIMSFIVNIIQSKKTEKQPNCPATHMERYFGIALYLDVTMKVNLNLQHLAHHGYTGY